MSEGSKRNLFSYDPSAFEEKESQEENKTEEQSQGRNLFQQMSENREEASKSNDASDAADKVHVSQPAPRKIKASDDYPAYEAYRDSAQKADSRRFDETQNTYFTKKSNLDKQQKVTDKARDEYTKAVNARKALDNLEVKEKNYTVTVGGKDVVAPLKMAYEKGWMTPSQKAFIGNAPANVLGNLGFTEKGQMENFELTFLNNEWTRRFLNPVMTADIFKKHVVRRCYIPALIGFVCCLLSLVQVEFFSIFCYPSMFFVGMGMLQIILTIIRIFTTPKGGRPKTGTVLAFAQFLIAVLMGRPMATVLRLLAAESFAGSAVTALLLCWCSVYFMANLIAAFPYFSNLILEKDGAVRDGLYVPLFQEAEKINGSQAVFYCLLHHNELAALIDQNNYSANVKSADRLVEWKKNDLDKEESRLALCKKEEQSALAAYNQARDDLKRSLDPVSAWKKSPTIADMWEYWKKRKNPGEEDPFFPNQIWREMHDRRGNLTQVNPIYHNGEPIVFSINKLTKDGQFVAETSAAIVEVISAIKKICAGEVTRVSVLSPQAGDIRYDMRDAGYKFVSWMECRDSIGINDVYMVSRKNEFDAMFNTIEGKKNVLGTYLDENMDSMEKDKNGKRGIAQANKHRYEYKGGTMPILYDILLIYVPVSGDTGSNEIDSVQLRRLIGNNSRLDGILPIYIVDSKRAIINENWNGMVKGCIKAITL